MNRLFRSWWPKTLRLRLMLVMVPVISGSMITAGYFLTEAGKAAILQEKRSRKLQDASLRML